MSDSLLPAVAFDAYLAEPGVRYPALAERFLPPREFVWGSFSGERRRRAALGAFAGPRGDSAKARAACVIAVGFGEFIEKHFETMRDLAARGIAVWCLDWRGQGRSIRPSRFPTRPRARNFSRDAEDLAEFAHGTTAAGPAAVAGGAFDGRRDRAGLPAPLSRPVRRRGAVLADGRAAHRTPAPDPGARPDGAGARRRARPPLYPRRAGMAPRPRADAADQPRHDRRRALPAAACVVLRRPGAASRPGDLWLGGQCARPRRAHFETGISRRDPHPDPDRAAGRRAGRLRRGATPGRRQAAELPARRAGRVEARPVSRMRCGPRLLVRLSRPVHRRAHRRTQSDTRPLRIRRAPLRYSASRLPPPPSLRRCGAGRYRAR